MKSRTQKGATKTIFLTLEIKKKKQRQKSTQNVSKNTQKMRDIFLGV